MYITDQYYLDYKDERVGYYCIFNNRSSTFGLAWGCPEETVNALESFGLKDHMERKQPIKFFTEMIKEENRVPGRKRPIYVAGDFRLEREPQETDERYSVYRRSAEKGAPDYSPLNHDAPHYEGEKTPEGMREWASWYAFVKMDDGTYQAELDEAWWWGGGHNDGGTIHAAIPEEIFDLPYDEFLEEVVCYAAAAHYGFTAEMLKEKPGLKEFFGFKDE